MAISTYDDYQESGISGECQCIAEQAKNQDNISEVLAFAAIGIWITDMVWTIIGTSDMNKEKNPW